ncbi:CHAT domain-containing protein [Methylorubrum extorquens]|uniref:CHAT domain-containing protein n=1 Tax=Methylorubrum extorquens DSM 13060 TaxID=882800 RepID=H1KCL2_METEX|nr:CHAT domain-containing protein [Methylorubrum extorquens]EHP94685.1 hypothetical protein MetexDRAFT_0374 [Methylorubrum extorquens DSM 13060]
MTAVPWKRQRHRLWLGLAALIVADSSAWAATSACDRQAAKLSIAAAAQGNVSDPLALEQALTCAGAVMTPAVAAAAAYELTVFYARAGAADHAAFRRAAIWARESASFLRSDPDPTLRLSMSLEALRLDYYAADSTLDLRASATATRAFIRSCQSPPGPKRPCDSGLKLLGEILRDSVARGQADSRPDAVEAFRRYLKSPGGRQQNEDRASALLDLGTLLAQRADDLDAAEVDEAVGALRDAGTLLADASERPRLAMAQVNLGALLTARRPTAIGLVEAERLLRPWAIPVVGIDRSVTVAARRNLGGALFRKQVGNREENLTAAIDLLRSAVAETSPDRHDDWIRSATGLAIALEASSLNERERLDEAVRLLERATGMATPNLRRARSKALSILMQVKLHQHRIGVEVKPVEIEGLLSRVRADAGSNPREAAQLAALAAEVAETLGEVANPGRRDAAIRELDTALARLGRDRDPTLWATLQNNLGNLCNVRRRPDLASCAARAYERALSVRTSADLPREHAETLVNLANLHFASKDWRAAAKLYGQVAQLSRDGFNPALGRDILLHDAARSDRWFERAAFALAELGDPDQALAVADAGRVRWLRQRLGADQLRPDAGPVGLDALPDGAVLLMPIVTTAGTVVLASTRRGGSVKTRHLMLPSLDGGTVAAFIQAEWLQPYEAAFSDGGEAAGGSPEWAGRVARAGEWIGTVLIGPVLEWLAREHGTALDEMILSVQGELALLPSHAAVLPTGGRLIDRMRVSYVPSASLLEARPTVTGAGTLVTLHDPGAEQGLPYSPAEVAFAIRAGGEAPANALDEESFFRAFAKADILHFVGHAHFDPEEPQNSTLALAGGRQVRVRDVVERRLGRAPGLVVLSACETGRLETATMANEYVGLPAALMSVGAKGVVSSLWPVSDGPTLFLMARMLVEIQANGQHPAEALRRAQIWLSGSTGADLARLLRELKPAPDTPIAHLAARLGVYLRNERPYSAPALWAGFVYVGRR